MAGDKIGFDASGNLAIETSDIVDNAVTTAKILANAVTTSKILAGAVTNPKIAAGAVDTAELATGAVTGAKILAGSVDSAELANNSVTTEKFGIGAVTVATLDDALADLIPQIATITKEAEGTPSADDIRFTIQLQDAQGNNLAVRAIVDIWISTVDFGSPAAIATFAEVTGTIIKSETANAFLRVLSQSDGKITVIANPGSGVFTRFVMASIGPSTKSLQGDWVA